MKANKNKNNYRATSVMINRISKDINYMQLILELNIDDETKLKLINDITKTITDNIPKISTYFVNESNTKPINKTIKGDENK